MGLRTVWAQRCPWRACPQSEVLAVSGLAGLFKPVEPPSNLFWAILPCGVHDFPGPKRFEAHAIVRARRRHLSGFTQPLAIAAHRPRELKRKTGLAHSAVSGEHRNAVARQPALDQPLLPVSGGYAVHKFERLSDVGLLDGIAHGIEVCRKRFASCQQGLTDSCGCRPARVDDRRLVSVYPDERPETLVRAGPVNLPRSTERCGQFVRRTLPVGGFNLYRGRRQVVRSGRRWSWRSPSCKFLNRPASAGQDYR